MLKIKLISTNLVQFAKRETKIIAFTQKLNAGIKIKTMKKKE